MNFARNILKSFYFIIMTVILFFAFISVNTTFASTCVGNNYEQQMPLDGVRPPSVSFSVTQK